MSVVAHAESQNAGKSPKKGNRRQRHSKGLLLVALFKLTKAIFFGTVGIGALHLLHRNIGDLVMRVVTMMPFDPEGKFVSLVMDRADLIGNHQLKQVGLFSLVYACVCVVEGTGLYLEKTWAEYFTVALTVLALPWEIWELFREPTLYRFGLLGLNLLVLVYLVWVIQRMRKKLAGRAANADAHRAA